MKKLLIVFMVIFVIVSCGDDEEKVKETDFSCAGTSCSSSADCSCSAEHCMSPEIAGMPNVGPINAERCTVLNCNVADNATCPEGYECWALSMGKEYFPEGTESVCIKMPEETEDDNETVDEKNDEKNDETSDSGETQDMANDEVNNDAETDNELSDADESVPDNEPQDDDVIEDIWPSCYDQPCKKSDECCEGTKCLNKMAEMDPNINESEYCVIKDCTEGDDTTCPPDHTCLSSMMGNYCIKQ